MPRSLVADDAFLLSERGPVTTPFLEPGEDRLWIVDRNGAFVLSEVRAVSSGANADAWRLLTAAGDLVLPAGARVTTSDGALSGAEIDASLQGGKGVRVDIVTVDDVPAPVPMKATQDEVVRSALAALPGRVIQLPQDDAVAGAIGADLARLLRLTEVRFRRIEDERWLAFVLESLTATPQGCRSSFGIQADTLSMATAWASHGDGVESRVRVADHRLRRRLLAAHVGAGRPFELRWLPGYRPVDSRVRTSTDRPWAARIPVHAASRDRATAVEIELAGSGDPIVSLAVITSGIGTP
jgi:hypothetical protein